MGRVEGQASAAPEGGGAAGRIPLVAAPDIGQDRLVGGLLPAIPDLAMPSPRALLGGRRDEQLHVGIRADDRTDVAPIEHRPGRTDRERALEREERIPHRLEGRNHGGGLAHLGPAQTGIILQGRGVQRPGDPGRGRLVRQGEIPVEQGAGHGPVQEAGVQV